jgi:hypothetical protein
MLSRRDFLKLTTFLTASAALSSCTPVYRRIAGELPTIPWTPLDPRDFLALNRLGFGPRVEERARFAEIGFHAFIEEQLAFDSISDFDCEILLRPFKTLYMDANEIEAVTNKLFEDYDRELPLNELRQATLLRQIYSERQLYELMVEFWNDHFNIFIEKGNCFYLKTIDDREVIRRHALGSFRDLVWASAHSPAMLVYLDNHVSEKSHPNENYARELMELHTLSVDGGYTQQDVMELARCLTGWTVKEHFWLGEFTFNRDFHDWGEKKVLGRTIQPEGQEEGEWVIEQLVAHPSTARFIATKLTRRFIADNPPQIIIEKAARVFLNTNGDIKSVLRVILLDGLALAQPKYKRPANFITSAMRLTNTHTDAALHDYLLRMGQPYFGLPTPDGYPDLSAPWQNNLMPRWQFAFELMRDEIPGAKNNLNQLLNISSMGVFEDDVDALTSLLLGAPLERLARDELIASVKSAGANDEEILPILAAGIIASPAFQWR